MTNKDFYRAFGNIDPKMIEAAAPAEKMQKKKGNLWLKWGAFAACLCLGIGVAFRVAIGFVPSQMTDVFREGVKYEIETLDDLPAKYNGKLLAENFDLTDANDWLEFYYREDGDPANTADWYSLLVGNNGDGGEVLMHCMFGDTTVEDWKVSMVFTKKATQKLDVNGVEVQIARQEPSLRYAYWYYAIFEYDDVVYDVRVQSNNAEYIYEVLDTLLNAA